MDKYRYSAVDDTGKKVSGTEAAASRSAAHLALLERGYQTIEVSEKKSVLQFEITKKLVPAQGRHALLAPAQRLRASRYPHHGGARGHRRARPPTSCCRGRSTT